MSADVAELEALSRERMETAMRRDHETLRAKFMLPEFTLVSRRPPGYIDRETWIGNLEKISVSDYVHEDFEVRSVGPVALVRSHQRWVGLPGSMMPTAEADVVDVWIDTAAGWRVLRRQVIARRETA